MLDVLERVLLLLVLVLVLCDQHFIMPNAQCPDFCHWPEYEGIGLPRATRL